ncbi:MAG: hypothetical protein IJT16_09680 [Lachnospiraceae bacterium]|nr:hypothetical protein [Lachnospiraceae bacterium]
MNIPDIMKIKTAWDTFTANHPKFPMFLNAVRNKGITEDTILAVTITYPDGQVLDTNIKVTASDLELYETLKSLRD